MSFNKIDRRNRIRNRVRKIINGTEKKPRLSVFRSNKEIYSQLINDSTGKTIASASSRDKVISEEIYPILVLDPKFGPTPNANQKTTQFWFQV